MIPLAVVLATFLLAREAPRAPRGSRPIVKSLREPTSGGSASSTA